MKNLTCIFLLLTSFVTFSNTDSIIKKGGVVAPENEFCSDVLQEHNDALEEKGYKVKHIKECNSNVGCVSKLIHSYYDGDDLDISIDDNDAQDHEGFVVKAFKSKDLTKSFLQKLLKTDLKVSVHYGHFGLWDFELENPEPSHVNGWISVFSEDCDEALVIISSPH